MAHTAKAIRRRAPKIPRSPPPQRRRRSRRSRPSLPTASRHPGRRGPSPPPASLRISPVAGRTARGFAEGAGFSREAGSLGAGGRAPVWSPEAFSAFDELAAEAPEPAQPQDRAPLASRDDTGVDVMFGTLWQASDDGGAKSKHGCMCVCVYLCTCACVAGGWARRACRTARLAAEQRQSTGAAAAGRGPAVDALDAAVCALFAVIW